MWHVMTWIQQLLWVQAALVYLGNKLTSKIHLSRWALVNSFKCWFLLSQNGTIHDDSWSLTRFFWGLCPKMFFGGLKDVETYSNHLLDSGWKLNRPEASLASYLRCIAQAAENRSLDFDLTLFWFFLTDPTDVWTKIGPTVGFLRTIWPQLFAEGPWKFPGWLRLLSGPSRLVPCCRCDGQTISPKMTRKRNRTKRQNHKSQVSTNHDSIWWSQQCSDTKLRSWPSRRAPQRRQEVAGTNRWSNGGPCQTDEWLEVAWGCHSWKNMKKNKYLGDQK